MANKEEKNAAVASLNTTSKAVSPVKSNTTVTTAITTALSATTPAISQAMSFNTGQVGLSTTQGLIFPNTNVRSNAAEIAGIGIGTPAMAQPLGFNVGMPPPPGVAIEQPPAVPQLVMQPAPALAVGPQLQVAPPLNPNVGADPAGLGQGVPDLGPAVQQLNNQIIGQAAQMNNNMLISSIEAYNGVKGTVDDFIRAIENVSLIAGWTEQVIISVALLKLKGLALEHMQQRARPLTWTDFKALLRRRFAPPATELTSFSNLKDCQQKAGERVVEFSHRLHQWCSKSTFGAEDRIMLPFFITGLRPQLQNMVLMRNPQTFEEALNAAQYAEGCELLTHPKRTLAITTEHGKEPNVGNIQCYHCKRLGHYRRECKLYHEEIRTGRNRDYQQQRGNIGRNTYQPGNGRFSSYGQATPQQWPRKSYRDVLIGSRGNESQGTSSDANRENNNRARFGNQPRVNPGNFENGSRQNYADNAQGRYQNNPNGAGANPRRR